MEIFESCNAVRKTLNKSGLHYFVKESPFSLWITIRKKRILATNEFVENDFETLVQSDKDLEIKSLKEKLLEREIVIKSLKINNKNLKASAKNYAKQVKIKDQNVKLLEEKINQTPKFTAVYQTNPDATQQFEKFSNFHKTLSPLESQGNLSTNLNTIFKLSAVDTIPITSLQTNPINTSPTQSNFTTNCPAIPYQSNPCNNILSNLNTSFSVTPTDDSRTTLTKPILGLTTSPIPKSNSTTSFQMICSNTNLRTFPDSSINTNSHQNQAFVDSESSAEFKKHFKPFSCDLCGERFLKASNVDFHINRLHNAPFK